MKHIIITITVMLFISILSSCSTYRKYSRPGDVMSENIFGKDVEVVDSSTIAVIPSVSFLGIRIYNL